MKLVKPPAPVLHPWETRPSVSCGRPTRAISAAEFWQMERLGWFGSQRLELLGGEIVPRVREDNRHAISSHKAHEAFETAFGPSFWVRTQATLDLSDISVVDPDIAVVEGDVDAWIGRDNPTTALLVVEVSLTTLAEDRTYKASLYASAGIADYWVVNLVDGTLEVRRDPVPLASAPFGSVYSRLTIHPPTDAVAPLAAPAAAVLVADLLPR